MAGVAAEPQRLIAVSLGKIASSRSQRGGINLHKNLLVASVLHKARTAYMMENFQQMLAAKRAQAEQMAQTHMPEKTSANPPNSTSHEVHVSRSENNPVSPRLSEPVDKENTPPRQMQPAEKMETFENNVCTKSTDSVLKSCDNSPSVNQQGKQDQLTKASDASSCLLKRRRSHNAQDMDAVLAKKARYSENVESDSHSEPMQTEPTQITNLVSIFNTGFGGLCSQNTDNSDLQRGYSRSDTMSCSSQVEHHVGLPTVIALTV